MSAKRIDEEPLGPEGQTMLPVHAAPPLGPTQGEPVGGAVTSAPKAPLLDQRFQ